MIKRGRDKTLGIRLCLDTPCLMTLLYRSFCHCLLEQFPERSYCRDEATLCCGVRRTHCRTERNHVEVRIFAQDNRAFQSCMVNLLDCVLIEQFALVLFEQLEYLAVGVGVPTAILSAHLNLHACHRECRLQSCGNVVAHALS